MSLLSDIGQLLSGRTSSPSRKLAYGRVENVVGWPSHPGPQGFPPAVPGTVYFRWFLQEMWLRREREWLAHYYPLVYASTSVQFGAGDLELPATLGEFDRTPQGKFVDLSNTLRLNYPMTPLLPYNGGTVELAAALVGIKSQDGIEQLVKAVGALGAALAVPQLSAVASFAGPVANTVSVLAGQGDKRLELGLHQTFAHGSQEELTAGYYLAAAVDDGLELRKYRVNEGFLEYADVPGKRVREFDYMLFRLETMTDRDDLEGLTAIFNLVAEAERAADNDRLDRAKAYVRDAKRAAWHSQDLTKADRARVPKVIDDQFASYLQTIGISGGGAAYEAIQEERGLLARVREIPAEQALGLSEDDVANIVFR